MGARPAHMIEKGAKYLIEVLLEKGQIDYDFFYDATEETQLKLINGIGITQDDADYYCAEAIMDNAAYELEEQGIVEIKELDSILADETNNYRIILTDAGKRRLEKGVKLEFYDAE